MSRSASAGLFLASLCGRLRSRLFTNAALVGPGPDGAVPAPPISRIAGGRPTYFRYHFGDRQLETSHLVPVQGIWRIVCKKDYEPQGSSGVRSHDSAQSRPFMLLEREDGFLAWFPEHTVSGPDHDGFIELELWWLDRHPVPHYNENLHAKRRLPVRKIPPKVDLSSLSPSLGSQLHYFPHHNTNSSSYGRDPPPDAAAAAAAASPTLQETRKWTEPSLSAEELFSYRRCPRQFYLAHVLQLPTQIRMSDIIDRSVRTMFAAAWSMDPFLVDAAGSSYSAGSAMWPTMMRWYHAHVRQLPWFDQFELNPTVFQAWFGLQQSLAFATNRRVWPSLPTAETLAAAQTTTEPAAKAEDAHNVIESKTIPPRFMNEVLSAAITVPLEDGGVRRVLLSDVIWAFFPGTELSKPILQYVKLGDRNEKPDILDAEDSNLMDRLKLQQWLLRMNGAFSDHSHSHSHSPEAELSRAVSFTGPEKTVYETEIRPSSVDSLVRALEQTVRHLVRAVSTLSPELVQDERRQKLGSPSQDFVAVCETRVEADAFPANVSTRTCSTCRFRAFCKPFQAAVRDGTMPFLNGDHRWLVARTLKTTTHPDDKTIAQMEVAPLDRQWRDFQVIHKGVIAQLLFHHVQQGDEVMLTDCNLWGDEAHGTAWADINDAMSLVVNGSIPSIWKLERDYEASAEHWRQYLRDRNIPEDDADCMHYNLEGLRFVSLE